MTIRNIRLDLEYDGRNYCGWQWQPSVPTLEREMKRAIETIVGHEITVYSHGRTDAGVHAEQHVMHFYSTTKRTPLELLKGINALLPDDISVYRVFDVPEKWSARHDPFEREYRYTFYNDLVPSALWRHRTLWIRQPLDRAAMQRAAAVLVGRHDFSAFRSLHCDADSPVRLMKSVTLEAQPPFIHLRMCGHAFLRHQVRITAGTILEIGMQRMPAERMEEILLSKDREQAGPTLPGQALTLVAVRYEGDVERFQGQRVYVGN
jgi:tRNA pseudouridine38-40 synthase